MIELIHIKPTLEENPEFAANPDCKETLQMSIDYYQIIGFHPPWVCYYALLDGRLVGSAAYKGRPVKNRVEIAYGTVERFRNQGIGSQICQELVKRALQTDPGLQVTARTLPEENYSARILRKNHFRLLGTVLDPEDGEVWEWIYERPVA